MRRVSDPGDGPDEGRTLRPLQPAAKVLPPRYETFFCSKVVTDVVVVVSDVRVDVDVPVLRRDRVDAAPVLNFAIPFEPPAEEEQSLHQEGLADKVVAVKERDARSQSTDV